MPIHGTITTMSTPLIKAPGNLPFPTGRTSIRSRRSFGGPIIRNKTFFFGLFDQNFVRTRAVVNGTVLTDTARQGIYRYFDGWTPDDADATPGTSSRPAVNSQGIPLTAAEDPLLYTGQGLICFSVFGNQKVNPSTFEMSSVHGSGLPRWHRHFPHSHQRWLALLGHRPSRCRYDRIHEEVSGCHADRQ